MCDPLLILSFYTFLPITWGRIRPHTGAMPVRKYTPDFKLKCTCIDISTRNYGGENNLQEGVYDRYLDQLSSAAMLVNLYVAAQNGLETGRAEETLSRLKIRNLRLGKNGPKTQNHRKRPRSMPKAMPQPSASCYEAAQVRRKFHWCFQPPL